MPLTHHQTPLGIVRIMEEDGFIRAIHFMDEEEIKPDEPSTPLLKQVALQLDEYFAGVRQIFDFPIKQHGSDFQQEVWQCLSGIDYGKTISYGQQSNIMKNPLAIRAIASANGKNNMVIVVPCHRVIGADGSLTGFASGIWRKKWLLEHEAKVLGVGQMKLF